MEEVERTGREAMPRAVRHSIYSEADLPSETLVPSRNATSKSFRESVLSAITVIDEHIEVGTVPGTVLNTVCNVVGAGVLTLPQAFSRFGLVTGCVVCLVICLDSMFSAYILFVACERSQEFFLNSVFAAAIMGKRPPSTGEGESPFRPPSTGEGESPFLRHRRRFASIIVDLSICTFNYMILIVYCGLMADSAVSVFTQFTGGGGVLSQRWFWIGLSSIVFLFLTSLRNMAELKWSSLLGIVTIVAAVVMVAVKYAVFGYQGDPSQNNITMWLPSSSAPAALGTFSVAFGYHMNAPIFYHELRDRNPSKMLGTVYLSFPLIFVVYIVVAVFGYLSFGEGTSGVIMDNYGPDDTVANVIRIGLFLHFACVYPVLSVCLRQTAHRVGLSALGRFEEAESPDMAVHVSKFVIVLEALVIVATSSLISYVWTDTGKIVSIIGDLTGTNFIMTIPGAVGMCVWCSPPAAPREELVALVSDPNPGEPPATTIPPDSWAPPPLWRWRRLVFAVSTINVLLGLTISVVGLAEDLLG